MSDTQEKPIFKNGSGKDVYFPERDEGLLLAANRAATGANIHDVNEAKSKYLSSIQYAERKPSAYSYSLANEYKRSLQELLIKIEKEKAGVSR